jgi:hypothetical protein
LAGGRLDAAEVTFGGSTGPAWNDNGGLVFTSRWGESLYPDTVTALMSKLIREYTSQPQTPARHCLTLAWMTFVTCTPPPCCWQGPRYTSWQRGSATPTQR